MLRFLGYTVLTPSDARSLSWLPHGGLCQRCFSMPLQIFPQMASYEMQAFASVLI